MSSLLRYIQKVDAFLNNQHDFLMKKPGWIIIVGLVVSLTTALLHLLLIYKKGVRLRFAFNETMLHVCFFMFIYIILFILAIMIPVTDPLGERMFHSGLSFLKKSGLFFKTH